MEILTILFVLANVDESVFRDLHPDPFKDRYKTIFKYRKSPKVHLRYNLREQVKNMKSDVIKIEKIDVSKTRWPGIEKKQFFLEAPVSEKALHSYPSLGISVDHPQYPNRFFKRDTAKNSANILDEVDTVSDKSFLLENLIENLIESSFGPLQNDTELDLSVNMDYYNDSLTTSEPITLPSKRNLVPKMIIINETTNVVSINNTDENIDNNKYTGVAKDENNYKNVYNEMISKLSKHIDNQNNHSMELMEQILGHRFFDTSTSVETTEGQITPMLQTFTTGIIDDDEIVDTTETITYLEKEIEPKATNNTVNNTVNNTIKSSDKINVNFYKNIPINQTKAIFTNYNNSDYKVNYDNTNNTYGDSNNQHNNNNFQRKSRQRFVKKLQNSKKITTVV